MASEFDLQPRNVWPTILFRRVWQDATKEHPAIIDYLYDCRDDRKDNIDSGVAESMKSAQGLYESSLNLFGESDHAGLTKLIGFFDESVRQAVSLVNGRKVPPASIRVTFEDSWCHITNDGGFHDAHIHSGCSWCGIYYVQAGSVPEVRTTAAGNGVSRFYCPIGRGGLQADYGFQYLEQGTIDVPPMDGALILFPAYLMHSGLAYRGEKDRIVLAFNTTSQVVSD